MPGAPTRAYAVPVEVAFGYLADPRNRPEWQSSLRRVELVDEGPPRVGQRWRDLTAARIVPEMEITELSPASLGRDRHLARRSRPTSTLRFAPRSGTGARWRVVRGARRGLLRPVGWAATGAGLPAVRSDLRRAGRILADARRPDGRVVVLVIAVLMIVVGLLWTFQGLESSRAARCRARSGRGRSGRRRPRGRAGHRGGPTR